jgi:mevalonate kinase
MVESVARQREAHPEFVERTFTEIAEVVESARNALEFGDLAGLGGLLDQNQELLRGLHLSTVEVDALCTIAKKAGALGAKLTGAGGGGCAIALVEPEVADAVISAWDAAGYFGFAARVAPTDHRSVAREPRHAALHEAES